MNVSSLTATVAAAALVVLGFGARGEDSQQKTFASPEDAVVALVNAAVAGNTQELLVLFGPDGQKVLFAGDPVMDQRNREVFLVAYAERAALMAVDPSHRVLYIGYEDWPLPIPLVKEGKVWRFDTAAGAQEILYRRIGRNELNTIDVAQVYVEAQQEYAAQAHDGRPAGAYAQRIASTPGKHDGLYWKSEDPEEPSPLGEFAAEAAAQGYRAPGEQPTPFHGYLYRILTAQGRSAAGGERSYIANGEMRNGFALIAYPAAYRVSGVMTFLVDQDGVVYQKDLGAETPRIAADVDRFDPDSSWHKVE